MDEKKPRKKKAAADKEHKTPWQETYAGVQEIQDFLMGRIMLRRNADEMRVMRHRLPGGDGEDGGDDS